MGLKKREQTPPSPLPQFTILTHSLPPFNLSLSQFSILNSQSLAALLLLFLIPLLFIHDSTAFRFHYHFPFLGSISFAPYKYYKNLIHTQTERERKERKDVVISYCQNSVRSAIVVRKYIQEPVKTNFKFFSSVFFF